MQMLLENISTQWREHKIFVLGNSLTNFPLFKFDFALFQTHFLSLLFSKTEEIEIQAKDENE